MANDKESELELRGPKSLPIRKACTFGYQNNLKQEIDEIDTQCRELLAKKGFISDVFEKNIDAQRRELLTKKGLIVELFEENGLFEEFLDTFWPYGRTSQGERLLLQYFYAKVEFKISRNEVQLEATWEAERSARLINQDGFQTFMMIFCIYVIPIAWFLFIFQVGIEWSGVEVIAILIGGYVAYFWVLKNGFPDFWKRSVGGKDDD